MSLLAIAYLLYIKTCSRINNTKNITPPRIYQAITIEKLDIFTTERKNITLGTMTAKILIVDDNESVAEYISDLLISHGFHTTIFTNSKNALDYCKENLQKYKLVISDICMPDMNGDQLAKEILQLDSDIPIILCSGYVEHVSKEQLFDIGIKEFMDKPINSGKLLTIIGDLNLC